MIDPVKVQAYIDKMSGGKSPLNASFFIRLSEETQVPIQLILAQAAQESNFGTRGRAVRTKNMFNIGNYTEGDLYPPGHPKNTMNSKFMNSWEKGAYAYANIVKRDYLKDKDMNELLNSYVSDKGRYAEDLNYEKNLKWHLNKMGDLSVVRPPARVPEMMRGYRLQGNTPAQPDALRYEMGPQRMTADMPQNMIQNIKRRLK